MPTSHNSPDQNYFPVIFPTFLHVIKTFKINSLARTYPTLTLYVTILICLQQKLIQFEIASSFNGIFSTFPLVNSLPKKRASFDLRISIHSIPANTKQTKTSPPPPICKLTSHELISETKRHGAQSFHNVSPIT